MSNQVEEQGTNPDYAKPTLGAVSEAQVLEWKTKAVKWDALDAKIREFYVDENGNEVEEGDLGDMGEVAAMAFGWL